MPNKLLLKVLFIGIMAVMLAITIWAGLHQPVQQWGGLSRGPDRYWTVATFMDAYCGFLTFYTWVLFKERRAAPRIVWFIAIMLLGNVAMSAYVLWQLTRLRRDQDASAILAARNP